MAITYDDMTVSIEGMVFESSVVELRDKLEEFAPNDVTFVLSGCEDMHMAVLQQLLSYHKLYNATFELGSHEDKAYAKMIKGFC